jgi:hypothetical protein
MAGRSKMSTPTWTHSRNMNLNTFPFKFNRQWQLREALLAVMQIIGNRDSGAAWPAMVRVVGADRLACGVLHLKLRLEAVDLAQRGERCLPFRKSGPFHLLLPLAKEQGQLQLPTWILIGRIVLLARLLMPHLFRRTCPGHWHYLTVNLVN